MICFNYIFKSCQNDSKKLPKNFPNPSKMKPKRGVNLLPRSFQTTTATLVPAKEAACAFCLPLKASLHVI